jgi:type IV secretory pathway VirJ component
MVVVVAVLTSAAALQAAPQAQTFTVPTFGTVTTYQPDGPPQEVVLFVSGDGGWNLGVVGMAERLRREGALVVGIDIRAFVRRLESSKTCAYPAGALEELSRAVQLHFKLPRYHRPILIGYSSGATLVYAAIAAAPPETFAGAISLGFCPDIELKRPLCLMRGLKTTARARGNGYVLAPFKESSVLWMVLQGEVDQVCAPKATRAFVADTGSSRLFSLARVGHGFGATANWEPQYVEAYRAIANAHYVEQVPSVKTGDVAGLSLIEIGAAAGTSGDAMAILLTGDGGWADIDKRLAAGLGARGVPVVAWSSLDYYWTPRTPERASADLDRIITHYMATWRRRRVLIVGYSFGADVAPFLVNHLSEQAKGHVAGLALLSPSSTATFEFHMSDWFGGGADPRYPTRPEIERTRAPVTCVSATDDTESPCHSISAPRVRVAAVGTGHHFSGEYGRLIDLILEPSAHVNQ